MKQIFDFTKNYSGAIETDNEAFPCNLSFDNGRIIFSLVRPDNSLAQDPGMKKFSGYISTENGIMNFLATDAFQTLGSSNWRTYAKEQHQANSLIVTFENNDIKNHYFTQANIEYDNLDQIGNLSWTEIDSNCQSTTFKLIKAFEDINFRQEPDSIILNNYVNYLQQYDKRNILTVISSPFISYKSKNRLTATEFGPLAIRFSYFLQLLFGIRQSVTSVLLFEHHVPKKGNGPSPYYFFNQEIIKALGNSSSRRSIKPQFNVEDLDNVSLLYIAWHRFTITQQQICRLYFGEINSKEYIRDDRFKNLCSVIQGLEAFGFLTEIPKVKGDMNAKLRKATSAELQILIFGEKGLQFMQKLYELIGVQRDHYQHLNKPLKFDLNEIPEDIMTLNSLMQAIIRYHLLKAIGLNQDKIEKIILGDISFIKRKLQSIKLRVEERYT